MNDKLPNVTSSLRRLLDVIAAAYFPAGTVPRCSHRRLLYNFGDRAKALVAAGRAAWLIRTTGRGRNMTHRLTERGVQEAKRKKRTN